MPNSHNKTCFQNIGLFLWSLGKEFNYDAFIEKYFLLVPNDWLDFKMTRISWRNFSLCSTEQVIHRIGIETLDKKLSTLCKFYYGIIHYFFIWNSVTKLWKFFWIEIINQNFLPSKYAQKRHFISYEYSHISELIMAAPSKK